MDNKLSELSKPVAYSLRFRNMNGEPDKNINANTTFSTLDKAKSYGLGSRYVTQDDGKIVSVRDPSQDPIVEPLYSQEYVSALLVELERYKQYAKERDAENESLALTVGRLRVELEAKDKRIFELDRSETQLIEERDVAHDAIDAMYEAAIGERPEWSNWFGFADAVEEVAQVRAKLATPVRLQSPWVDKVGNRWLLEGTTADVIRAAGFKIEGED